MTLIDIFRCALPFSCGKVWVQSLLTKFFSSGAATLAVLLLIIANTAAGADVVWVEDATPAGAGLGGRVETWTWVSNSPAPYSGGLAHQSLIAAGLHQHYFQNASSAGQLPVEAGDALFAYVYLDPTNLPSQVMLEWRAGTSWEQRAYWGANNIGWGVDGTNSRRYMGPLPPAGQWVRLEVPASQVGLEGQTLNGMAFTLFDGRATWDRAGKVAASGGNTPPVVSLTAPANGSTYTAPAGITLNATASDSDGISKIEFYNGATLLGTDTASPYSWPLANVGTGSYIYTAKAYDSLNASASSEPVAVTVNAANTPPTVSLTAPVNGSTYTAPAAITLNATASDSDGISKVEFYNGATLLGTDTASPYSWSLTNVAAGSYSYTAKAYDTLNAVTTSTVVGVSVNAANTPPTVSLTAPTNGSTYTAPAAITLNATASDSDGISKVEFYNGATLLGTDTTSPYSWPLANVAAGSYSYIAKAYDTLNAVTTSNAASVTVNGAIAAEVVWVEDSPPTGAGLGGRVETWSWIAANPSPYSGSLSHQSVIAAGLHQHYFQNASSSSQLPVVTGDTLFAYVYLDPANPPSQIMLEWTNGSWEHRAYWGANNIGWGVDGTNSRRYMGPLPPAGQWVRLEVPASQVGLEGQTLNGMAFTLFDGRAAWDRAGKVGGAGGNTPPTVSLTAPASGSTYTTPASITLTASASDSDGIAKVEFYNGATLLGTDTTAPYSWPLANVAAGSYSYTAKAYDSLSASTNSEPVAVTVNVDNIPPTVSLTSPASTYTAPASITLNATANDSNGISKVEFYNGATLLGTDTSAPYSWSLAGVAAGSYSYTAKAYDSLNASTTSSAVSVTVNAANVSPAIGSLTAAPPTLTDTATSQLQVVASDADAGPSPLSYAWSIVSGGGSLSSSTAANPVYTPANVSVPTSAVIKVTVSDGAASVNQSLTLTVNDTPVRSESITYYHNDALGSPIAATDQSGNLLWRETYRPYGERLNNQTASGTNPLWYTGKRQDPETGLVYMGSRYYDPRLGRFLSIDPVEPDENNLHSLNRYAYANNNPYKFTDPDGQIAETIIDVVSLGLSINTFRQDPSFLNGLAVAYDGFATAVPFLPAGIGIIRQAATKGETLTQVLKQAADRGAAKAGEGAKRATTEIAETGNRTQYTPGGRFSKSTKEVAAERAGHKCEYCGVETVAAKKSERGVAPPRNEGQTDHIVSRKSGGLNSPDNAAHACRSCNRGFSDNPKPNPRQE